MGLVRSELPQPGLPDATGAWPDYLTCVLESRTFEKSPTLRTLLVYLWSHRNDPVNEYVIATEALGRTSAFDPKFDATVRVQISRLRQRLERFYELEGRDRSPQVTIPLGTHQILLKQISLP